MPQDAELARVKARIRTLAERTVSNGCTEAEAIAAATLVGRLLERYALAMDEIDIRAEPCVQVLVPTAARRRPIDACVPAIARFCDCKVWLAPAAAAAPTADAPAAPQAHYVFFGFDTDAALAAYLFAVIERALATELARFRRIASAPSPARAAEPTPAHATPSRHEATSLRGTTPPRGTAPLRGTALRRASASFQHGLAARAAARLATLRDERDAAVRAQRSTGTALAIVKHGVVEAAFQDSRLRLVARRRAAPRPLDTAYREGWAAGGRVNLERPLAPAPAPRPLPGAPHRDARTSGRKPLAGPSPDPRRTPRQ